MQSLSTLDPKDYEQTAILISEYINQGRITDLSFRLVGGKRNRIKGTKYSRVHTYHPYTFLECAPLTYTESDKYITLDSMPMLTSSFLDSIILYVGVQLHKSDPYIYPVFIPKALKPHLLKLRQKAYKIVHMVSELTDLPPQQ